MTNTHTTRVQRVLSMLLLFCMISTMLNWDILKGLADDSEPHHHTFACYQKYWLECEYADDEDAEAHGHYHTYDCWACDTTYEPLCQMEEGTLHSHNERYGHSGFVCKDVAKVLVCGKPIHIHSADCIEYVPIEKDEIELPNEEKPEQPGVDGTEGAENPDASETPNDGEPTEDQEVPEETPGNPDVIPESGTDTEVPEVPEEPSEETPDAEEPTEQPTEDESTEELEVDEPLADGEEDPNVEYEIRYICGYEQHEKHTEECFETVKECRWRDTAVISEGGLTLEGTWMSGGDYTEISDDNMHITYNLTSHDSMTYELHFAVAKEPNTIYQPGTVKIYVPKCLFKLRDGTEVTFSNIASMLKNNAYFKLESSTVQLPIVDGRPVFDNSSVASIALDENIQPTLIEDIPELQLFSEDVYSDLKEHIENDDTTITADTPITEDEHKANDEVMSLYDEAITEENTRIAEEKAEQFSLSNLLPNEREQEYREFYVISNTQNILGNNSFTFSGYIEKDLWRIIDKSEIYANIWVTGEDTTGVASEVCLPFSGTVDTDVVSSTLSNGLIEDRVTKRHYSYSSTYTPDKDAFMADTAINPETGMPDYAYVTYAVDKSITGTKYLDTYFTIELSHPGELVYFDDKDYYSNSKGSYKFLEWDTTSGIECPWTKESDTLYRSVNFKNKTSDKSDFYFTIKYKIAGNVLDETGKNINTTVTFSTHHNVEETDNDTSTEQVNRVTGLDKSLSIEHNSTVVWTRTHGKIYGGDFYFYPTSFHNEWHSLLNVLAKGGQATISAVSSAKYNAYLMSPAGDDGEYYPTTERKSRFDNIVDKFYLSGGPAPNNIIDLQGTDTTKDKVPSYYITGLSDLTINDTYTRLDQSGNELGRVEGLPETYQDMKVGIYVTTAEDPNTWVLDQEIPLFDVFDKDAEVLFNTSNVQKVNVSYPGAYASASISYTLDFVLDGSNANVRDFANRALSANADSVQMVGYNAIIPYSINSDKPFSPATEDESFSFGGTASKQVTEWDNTVTKAWYATKGMTGYKTWSPYRVADYTEITPILSNTGLESKFYVRNTATGEFISNALDLNIQVADRLFISNHAAINLGAEYSEGAKEILSTVSEEENHPFNATEAVFFVLLPENMEFRNVTLKDQTSGISAVSSSTGTIENTTYKSGRSIKKYADVPNFRGTNRTLVIYGVKNDPRDLKGTSLDWWGQIEVRPYGKDIPIGTHETYTAVLWKQGDKVVNFDGVADTTTFADTGAAFNNMSKNPELSPETFRELATVYNTYVRGAKLPNAEAAKTFHSIMGLFVPVTLTGRPTATDLYVLAHTSNEDEGYEENITIYPTEDYHYRMFFQVAGQQQVTKLGIIANIEDDIGETNHFANNVDNKQNTFVGKLNGIDTSGVPTEKLSGLKVFGNPNFVDLNTYATQPNEHYGDKLNTLEGWTEVTDWATRTDWTGIKALYFYFGDVLFGDPTGETTDTMFIKLMMNSPEDKAYVEGMDYQTHLQAVYVNNLFNGIQGSSNMYTGSGSNIVDVNIDIDGQAIMTAKADANPWNERNNSNWVPTFEATAPQFFADGYYHYRWDIRPASAGITTDVFAFSSVFPEGGTRGSMNLTGWDITASNDDCLKSMRTYVYMLPEDKQAYADALAKIDSWDQNSEEIEAAWRNEGVNGLIRMQGEVSTGEGWTLYRDALDKSRIGAVIFDFGSYIWNTRNDETVSVVFHGIAGSVQDDTADHTTLNTNAPEETSVVYYHEPNLFYRVFGFSGWNQVTASANIRAMFNTTSTSIRASRVDSNVDSPHLPVYKSVDTQLKAE